MDFRIISQKGISDVPYSKGITVQQEADNLFLVCTCGDNPTKLGAYETMDRAIAELKNIRDTYESFVYESKDCSFSTHPYYQLTTD